MRRGLFWLLLNAPLAAWAQSAPTGPAPVGPTPLGSTPLGPAPLVVQVPGTCPSREALLQALEGRGVVRSAAGLTLQVIQEPRGATLRLDNAAGSRVLERTIASDDCPALAAAFSLIVEGTLVELGIMKPSGPAEPAFPLPAAPEPAVMAPMSATPVVAAAGLQSPATSAPLRRRYFGMVGTGLEALPFSSQWAGALELGGGWNWRSLPLFTQIQALTSSPTVLGDSPNRVGRWGTRAQISVGIAQSSSPRFNAWVGWGLSVVRLEAKDRPAATVQWRWSPLATLGVGLRFPTAGRLSLGPQASCFVLGVQERYLGASEELGRGPRLGCNLMVDFFWGQR